MAAVDNKAAVVGLAVAVHSRVEQLFSTFMKLSKTSAEFLPMECPQRNSGCKPMESLVSDFAGELDLVCCADKSNCSALQLKLARIFCCKE
ncbi:MAG TPA: hypothetical protein VM260_15480, partial [Pirellula sp.]|nr:hypothetical protein [Pirellula sp.]